MDAIKQVKAFVMLADGFEEIEAMTPIDFLRRADIPAALVAVSGARADENVIQSSRGVSVIADCALADALDAFAHVNAGALIILPGGMPGAANLAQSEALQKALVSHHARGGLIAAICAAPAVVLGPLGILKNKQFTCYPSMETAVLSSGAASEKSAGAVYKSEPLVKDGNLITANGAAAAAQFSRAVVAALSDEATAERIWSSMLFPPLAP